jgi:ATP-binding cassette subfamily B protein
MNPTSAARGARSRIAEQLTRTVARVRRRSVPLVNQLTIGDCGLACLAMVLGYHGQEVELPELRRRGGKDNCDALTLKRLALAHGLQARGVRIELDELAYLPTASILHWEMRHFVVFERLVDGAVCIVDPALGRRRLSLEEFSRAFTGIALVCNAGEARPRSARPDQGLFRFALSLFRNTSRIPRVVVLSAFAYLLSLALPLLLGALVDKVVPRGDARLLIVFTALIPAVLLLKFLAALLRAHLLIYLSTSIDTKLTTELIAHLLSLPFPFFSARPAGDLVMRLNSNGFLRDTFLNAFVSTLIEGSMLVINLVLLLVLSGPMAAAAIAAGLAQVGIFAAAATRQRELMSECLRADAERQSYEVQALANIESVKAMAAEPHVIDRWSNLFAATLNRSIARARLDSLIEASLGALRLATPVAMMVVGGWLVLSERLSLGTMLASSAIASGFLEPLATMVGIAGRLQLARSYLVRIKDITRVAPEAHGEVSRTVLSPTGAIRLEEVAFRYESDAPLVLDGVSADIPAGSFVAVVGRSGSGKSTLARLLLGLYRPSSGRLLYDGADLEKLDLGALRARVGVVPQSLSLLGASVRDAIAFGQPGLSLSDIQRAAELAHIAEEIEALPLGYDTPLYGDTFGLSGGQRQRLALARALVRNPSILILDEATSALDAVAEARLQTALGELRCTRIVIAHRLSTVRDADNILVLDEGRLVEEGRHTQLLARRGTYASLLSRQLEVGA